MSLDRGWLIIEGRQQGCGDLWVDKTALCPLRIETFLRAFRYTTFMHARTFFFVLIILSRFIIMFFFSVTRPALESTHWRERGFIENTPETTLCVRTCMLNTKVVRRQIEPEPKAPDTPRRLSSSIYHRDRTSSRHIVGPYRIRPSSAKRTWLFRKNINFFLFIDCFIYLFHLYCFIYTYLKLLIVT